MADLVKDIQSDFNLAFRNKNGNKPDVARMVSTHVQRISGVKTATSSVIRKLIETMHSNCLPTDRRRIAETVGHSSAVQEKFYALRKESEDAYAGSVLCRGTTEKIRKMSARNLWEVINALSGEKGYRKMMAVFTAYNILKYSMQRQSTL